MEIEYHVTKEKEYLLIELTGEYSLSDFITAIEHIASEAHKEGYNKVLCDINKVQYSGPINTMDRFKMGEHVASVLGYKIKVAGVGPKEQINGFAELVASNRGGNLNIFTDKELALKWLLSKDR